MPIRSHRRKLIGRVTCPECNGSGKSERIVLGGINYNPPNEPCKCNTCNGSGRAVKFIVEGIDPQTKKVVREDDFYVSEQRHRENLRKRGYYYNV